MSADIFFHTHPVFRYEEFVAWKQQQGDVRPHSVDTALQYYLKKGRLKRLRREFYAVVLPGQSGDSLLVDSYLIAARAAADSVLSYHTALELHGVAYSTFEQLTYFTHQGNKPFEFQNRLFRAVTFPTVLVRTQHELYGVESVNRQRIIIQVTNLERTFVDVLDRIELSGGLEEVCRSVQNMVSLDVNQVVAYCRQLKNARLAAKVGFMLEQREGAFAVSKNVVRPLLTMKPRVPQYWSTRLTQNCQLVKRWNLMVPKSVLNQSWDEPDVDF